MTTEAPETENKAAGGQSRAGEAGANLTAVLGRAVESFNAMTIPARIAGRAMYLFGEAWVDMIGKAYLLEHDRLPGSEGSARLRKKRRSELLKWFQRRYGLEPNVQK